jgi:glutamyl-tRNA synthetase
MTVIVRFAPSPTGYLHVGNLRPALVNWLFARKMGGKLILRFDDTDTERSRPEFEEGIREDLTWLGLDWDESFRQQDRFALYEEAKQKLIADGRLYPCYETSEELEIKRKMLASRGKPPVYDRAALKLTDEQKRAYEAEGRKPHYRFLLEDREVVWDDLIRGKQSINPSHISDPVLVRADGIPLYTLSSTVDDGLSRITHILRGEDHVSNTPVQIQIFEALGYTPPQFSHNALLQMAGGKLSKRKGGGEIRGLRETGYEVMAVNSLLARLGTSDPIEIFSTMDELVTQFDIQKFGRASATYDEAELARLNEKYLAHLSFADAKPRLIALGMTEADEAFWLGIRGNLTLLADAQIWWEILHQPLAAQQEEVAFTTQTAALLPAGLWDEAAYKAWIEQIKAATGRKGKELFMPLRLALTGREDGPDLKDVFRLIDPQKARLRLEGNVA